MLSEPEGMRSDLRICIIFAVSLDKRVALGQGSAGCQIAIHGTTIKGNKQHAEHTKVQYFRIENCYAVKVFSSEEGINNYLII
jgi:hypothetical protein